MFDKALRETVSAINIAFLSETKPKKVKPKEFEKAARLVRPKTKR